MPTEQISSTNNKNSIFDPLQTQQYTPFSVGGKFRLRRNNKKGPILQNLKENIMIIAIIIEIAPSSPASTAATKGDYWKDHVTQKHDK
jgi:hypothetical protein